IGIETGRWRPEPFKLVGAEIAVEDRAARGHERAILAEHLVGDLERGAHLLLAGLHLVRPKAHGDRRDRVALRLAQDVDPVLDQLGVELLNDRIALVGLALVLRGTKDRGPVAVREEVAVRPARTPRIPRVRFPFDAGAPARRARVRGLEPWPRSRVLEQVAQRLEPGPIVLVLVRPRASPPAEPGHAGHLAAAGAQDGGAGKRRNLDHMSSSDLDSHHIPPIAARSTSR